MSEQAPAADTQPNSVPSEAATDPSDGSTNNSQPTNKPEYDATSFGAGMMKAKTEADATLKAQRETQAKLEAELQNIKDAGKTADQFKIDNDELRSEIGRLKQSVDERTAADIAEVKTRASALPDWAKAIVTPIIEAGNVDLARSTLAGLEAQSSTAPPPVQGGRVPSQGVAGIDVAKYRKALVAGDTQTLNTMFKEHGKTEVYEAVSLARAQDS